MKCTSRESRSSLATTIGVPLPHRLAALNAALSCGRRSKASAP